MEKELKALKEVKNKFYEFSQNNSGGSFVTDDKLCHRLIIEAKDEDEACRIAEDMGVYFNGCDDGMDCPCCGDRWYRPSEIDVPYNYGAFTKAEAEKIAEKYGGETVKRSKATYGNRDTDVIFSVEQYAGYLAEEYGWTSPDVRIFYKNGEVKEFESSKVVKRKKR